MRSKLLIATGLSFGLAMPVLAATNGTQPAEMGNTQAGNSQSGNAQGNNAQAMSSQGPLQQKIRQELAQGGFTDIQVMPQSFLVRAKDRDGNPVMMVISPNSVTAVTAIPNGQTAQNGGGNGAMGTSAMTNSAHAGNAINAPNGNGTPTH